VALGAEFFLSFQAASSVPRGDGTAHETRILSYVGNNTAVQLFACCTGYSKFVRPARFTDSSDAAV
jgi:hypothetical protein